jgi:prepilin-type N-terminal cleavage/methylation domain-containing protein/prepilin-type processing-associated H-X9-DG protein
MKHRAFTLIELLVVVGIICLLAAILFPVFARARESARRAACQSNLKQIGLAVAQYVQDYDEMLPISDGTDSFNGESHGGLFTVVWDYANTSSPSVFSLLQPYTKSWQVFTCPSAPSASYVYYKPKGNSNTNYSVNGILTFRAKTSATPASMGRKVVDIATPSTIIYIQEGSSRQNSCGFAPQIYNGNNQQYDYWHLYSNGTENYSNIHFNGGNLLYADGHVKWKKVGSLTSLDFGLSASGTNKVAGAYTQVLDGLGYMQFNGSPWPNP